MERDGSVAWFIEPEQGSGSWEVMILLLHASLVPTEQKYLH